MLSSLSGQVSDRKAYLASLRNKRKLENRPISDDIATLEESNEEQNAHQNDTKVNDKSKRAPITFKSRNFDQESREAVSGFKEPPTLKLSNDETVEVLASQIQDQILQNINEKLDNATMSGRIESTAHRKPKESSHNQDLKADIEEYTTRAEAKTNIAINKIIQQRYQDSMS